VPGPAQIRKGIRVLVVDDYRPLADLVVSALGSAGYEARAAYSGKEALRAIEEFKPHAAVVDAILPDMDGLDFAAEFERRFPSGKVLLTSAMGHEPKPSKVREAYPVIHKAMLMDELLPLLDSLKASEQP
jgi:DNA-binding response OmpR family regulator